jgi:hypothetical protein
MPLVTAGLLCFVSALAGNVAVLASDLYSESYEKKPLTHDLKIAAPTGAAVSGGIEIYASATSGWMTSGYYSLAELAQFSGLGLVCGAAGGLAGYTVKYFMRRNESVY